MNDCVRGREGGVIVDYGGGGSDAAVDGLQRLLLTLVTCQDHNGVKVQPLNVEAITPKMGQDIIDASSTTIRSYWLMR